MRYTKKMKFNIRLLYLYLFSFIGLLVVVIGSIQIVNLTLKVVIFKGADEYTISRPLMAPSKVASDEAEIYKQQVIDQKKETVRNRQREFSNAIAMILVGAPLYFFHWKKIQHEKS